jgi:hypothetical protein
MIIDFDLGDMQAEDQSPLIAAISYVIAPLLGFGGAVKSVASARPNAPSGPNTKAGMIPEAGALLGNIVETAAGAFNLQAVLNAKNRDEPLTPQQLAKAIEDVYVDFFTRTRDNIRISNEQFFKGIQPDQPNALNSFIDALGGMGVRMNKALHPVAQMLGSGEFASGGSGSLAELLQVGYKMARDQMVGAILAAQGVILFGNTKTDEGSCQGDRVWWDRGACHKFMRVKVEGNGVLESQDLDDDVVEKLYSDHFDYKIDLKEMMKNVRDCYNDFGGTRNSDFNLAAAYPRCHFGMAYFKADDEPCKMWPGPFGLEHGGCSGSFERLYWDKFQNGDEVPRQGTWPDSTLEKWMIPDLTSDSRGW